MKQQSPCYDYVDVPFAHFRCTCVKSQAACCATSPFLSSKLVKWSVQETLPLPTRVLPHQVFQIPEITGEGDKKKGPLLFKHVQPNDLTEVARVIRAELNKALVSRFYGRVWDPNTPDPSFFRDASVLLTPPFKKGAYLDGLALVDGDEEGLPVSRDVSVPTSATEVKKKLDVTWKKLDVTWKKLNERAVEAGRKMHEKRAESPASKLLQTNTGSKVSTSEAPKSDVYDEDAMFGDESDGDSDENVDTVQVAVDAEEKRYRELNMKTTEVLGSLFRMCSCHLE